MNFLAYISGLVCSFTWNSWYSFYWPWKGEILSRAWSHPVVSSMGTLGWESSTLTTKPLLQLKQKNSKNCKNESTKKSLPHITSSPEVWLFFQIIVQPLNHKPFAPSTRYGLKRRTLCEIIPWQVDFTVWFFCKLTIFNV